MGVELNYQFQKQVSTKWVPVTDSFSNDRSYLLRVGFNYVAC